MLGRGDGGRKRESHASLREKESIVCPEATYMVALLGDVNA
jgi:hypothetical protein